VSGYYTRHELQKHIDEIPDEIVLVETKKEQETKKER
jgi:hypothetical protein